MPLHIVVLDCSNYPQLLVVEEQTVEADRAKWEKTEGRDKPNRVFEHIDCYADHGNGQMLDVISSLCSIRQFERQFESVLDQVFRAGRRFERQYPEGRGSVGDKRVYHEGDELEYFVDMDRNELYRRSKTGLASWTGDRWLVAEQLSDGCYPVDESTAKFYLKSISEKKGLASTPESIDMYMLHPVS